MTIIRVVSRVTSANLAIVQGQHAVRFESGAVAFLPQAPPRSVAFLDVVNSAARNQFSVYFEVDVDTQTIRDIRVPTEGYITDISFDQDGNAEISVEISHRIHILRRDGLDFQRLLQIAKISLANRNQVAVTQRDGEGVIDITARGQSEVTSSADRPFDVAPPLKQSAMTPARAEELFNILAATSCSPLTSPSPCIPFLFPDDGCWGRAHEMCRLIIAEGESPRKMWTYGNLRANTPNHPDCFVRWRWHVAPTILVGTEFSSEVRVIDPSLATKPITYLEWRALQNPDASLVSSGADIFHRANDGTVAFDPDYSKTREVLERYRLELRLRSIDAQGPPPYDYCSAR